MTPKEKADNARRLIEDTTIKSAFIDIRERLVSQLETVPIADRDTQHEVALMLQLLKRLQTQLRTYIQEQLMDDHRKKQDSFIEKKRERLA